MLVHIPPCVRWVVGFCEDDSSVCDLVIILTERKVLKTHSHTINNLAK